MNSRPTTKLFRYITPYLIGISFFVCVGTTVPANQGLPPGLPQMSPAEQKQLEQEMATFQEEFNKLSPKEQESFYESMEDAVQKIEELAQTDEGKELLDKLDKGDISDEELDQLINQLVSEEAEEEPVPEKEEKVEEKPKVPVKPAIVISSKEQQAIDAINALIAHTNAFIVKVATMPEFPGNIKVWAKKGKFTWPDTVQSWSALKKDIEQFVSQLNTLLERDQKTGVYYHIDELLKSEALYNNLRKIQAVVAEHEPNIEEVSPLHRKISTRSKNAIQKMINQYIEALYTLKVPEELTALFKKFDPQAKIARQSEEKAAQAAAKARQPMAPTRSIIAGVAEEQAEAYPGYEPYPERRYARPTPAPTYRPEPSQPTRISEKRPRATGPKKGKAATLKEKKSDEDKIDDSGIDPALRKKAEEVSKARQVELDHLVNSIKDTITNAAKDLLGSATLKNLEVHLKDETPVDLTLVTELIPDILRELSVRKGALGKIAQLKGKLRIPKQRKTHQDKLKKMYEPHKKIFELVEQQITAIQGKFDTIKAEIAPEKLYAYFGAKEDEEEVEEKKEMIEEETTKVSDETIEALEKIAQDESLSAEERQQKALALLEKEERGQREKEVVEIEVEPKDEKLLEIERKLPSPTSLFELGNAIRDLKQAIDTFDKAVEKKKPGK